MDTKVYLYRTKLVKEKSVKYQNLGSLSNSEQVKVMFRKLYGHNLDREIMVVFGLNCDLKVLGVYTVSVGTLDSAKVYPREILKFALLVGAKAIILAHNHPTGHSELSEEDRLVTDDIRKVCRMVDIDVLDHVIIT